MFSFRLDIKEPGGLLVTDVSIAIPLDQHEQLTVTELKKRIIEEVKKKKNCKIIGGNLDINNLRIAYANKKGDLGIIGTGGGISEGENKKEIEGITQKELKEWSDRTVRFLNGVSVIPVETDEEIEERMKAEDKRVKRDMEISATGIKSQLDNMVDQFLAANTRLNDSLKNVSFEMTNDVERKISEDDKKIQLVSIWNTSLVSILASLPPDMAWEFFEILLKKFSAENPDKKIEIILVTDGKPDLDITDTLKMICASDSVKNKCYLILPTDMVNRLSNSAADNSIPCDSKIDTLSFLHHWSTNAKEILINDEANKATRIIKKIPSINMVVLRGCSTAGKIEDPALFSPKNIRIISAKKNLDTESVEGNEFLFQQQGGKTRIKYYDGIQNKFIMKELEDIPRNISGNRLSVDVEKALAAASDKYDLPLLSFKSKEMDKLINKIRKDWLQNKALSQEDKQFIKATENRTKTYVVSQFPLRSSLARALEEQLAKEGITVSIKSYGGPYKGYTSGPMIAADHGHHVLPKALKKLK